MKYFILNNVLSSASLIFFSVALQYLNQEIYIHYVLMNTILFLFCQGFLNGFIVLISRDYSRSQIDENKHLVVFLLKMFSSNLFLVGKVVLIGCLWFLNLFMPLFILAIISYFIYNFVSMIFAACQDLSAGASLARYDWCFRMLFLIMLLLKKNIDVSAVYCVLIIGWTLSIYLSIKTHKILRLTEGINFTDIFNYIKRVSLVTVVHYFPWTIANWSQTCLDKWIIYYFLSEDLAATYFIIMQLIYSPVLMISNIMTRVYLKNFYRDLRRVLRLITSRKYQISLVLIFLSILIFLNGTIDFTYEFLQNILLVFRVVKKSDFIASSSFVFVAASCFAYSEQLILLYQATDMDELTKKIKISASFISLITLCSLSYTGSLVLSAASIMIANVIVVFIMLRLLTIVSLDK